MIGAITKGKKFTHMNRRFHNFSWIMLCNMYTNLLYIVDHFAPQVQGNGLKQPVMGAFSIVQVEPSKEERDSFSWLVKMDWIGLLPFTCFLSSSAAAQMSHQFI